MFPTDFNSLLFLFLGRDSPWLPWIVLAFLLLQKGTAILEWLENCSSFRKTEYILSGCFYIDKKYGHCHGVLPSETEAFLYFLQTSNITSTLKKGITLFTGSCVKTDSDTESITIPCSGQGIWVLPTLYARFKIKTEQTHHTKRESDGDESSVNTIMMEECRLTITLQTKTGSFQDIRDFLQSCLTTYKAFKLSKANRLYVVKPSLDKSHVYATNYIDFKSNKTFDNLFFKGKEELLARLDQFRCVSGDCIATKLGLPSTLGLLFYGEPGTGKTSAIKAIANYMQKHLIIVPMNKIRTRRDLESLFYKTDVCWLPFDKRIYVFEEIDCNGWEDIVMDRKLCSEKEKARTLSTEYEKVAEKATEKLTDTMVVLEELKDTLQSPGRRKEKDETDKLTLGAILEMLDGVVECPGRMVIMTTNRRGVLDPALIRPGRIDMEIEFGRLGRKEIGEICRKLWCTDVDQRLLEQVPDGRLTQAELSQFLYKYTDPNKFLEALIEDGRLPASPPSC